MNRQKQREKTEKKVNKKNDMIEDLEKQKMARFQSKFIRLIS